VVASRVTKIEKRRGGSGSSCRRKNNADIIRLRKEKRENHPTILSSSKGPKKRHRGKGGVDLSAGQFKAVGRKGKDFKSMFGCNCAKSNRGESGDGKGGIQRKDIRLGGKRDGEGWSWQTWAGKKKENGDKFDVDPREMLHTPTTREGRVKLLGSSIQPRSPNERRWGGKINYICGHIP